MQAQRGRLRDQAGLIEQAKRLMASVPKASGAMHHFVEQWLHTEDVTVDMKDLTVFSMGTKEMAQDLQNETRAFFDSVLFQPGGDKSFKTLFTANYSFVNARTASLYGVQGVTGDALVKKDLDPAAAPRLADPRLRSCGATPTPTAPTRSSAAATSGRRSCVRACPIRCPTSSSTRSSATRR